MQVSEDFLQSLVVHFVDLPAKKYGPVLYFCGGQMLCETISLSVQTNEGLQ